MNRYSGKVKRFTIVNIVVKQFWPFLGPPLLSFPYSETSTLHWKIVETADVPQLPAHLKMQNFLAKYFDKGSCIVQEEKLYVLMFKKCE